MKLTKRQLKTLIENMLHEARVVPVLHTEVVAAIDEALDMIGLRESLAQRQFFSYDDFRQLVIEVSLVETGHFRRATETNVIDSTLINDNEQSGDIKGVFQMGSSAIQTLRTTRGIPTSLRNFRQANGGEFPSNSEIYGSLALQAAAASLYLLYAWFELYGMGDIASIEGRASLWTDHYNTALDVRGTTAYYINKLNVELDPSSVRWNPQVGAGTGEVE